MIGEKTEFNTVVTQKLIDDTQARVDRLKEKERNTFSYKRSLNKQNV